MSDSVQTFTLGSSEGNDYAVEEEKQQEMTPEQFVQPPEESYKPTRMRQAKAENVSYTEAEKQKRHTELLLILSRFHTSKFASYLQSLSFNLKPSHLRTETIEQLEEKLNRVQLSVMGKTSSGFFEGVVFTGTTLLEGIVQKSKWKDTIMLQGLTECLKKDETFTNMLSMIEITQNLTSGSPYILLLYSLLGACSKVHSVNAFLKARGQVMAKKRELEEGKAESKEEDKDEEKEDGDAPIEFESKKNPG